MLAAAKKVIDDLLSLAKVALKSKLRPEKLTKLRSSDQIVVMGNGPSLKGFLKQNRNFLEGKDLLAVNYAVLSEYFEELKPRHYVAIDPGVFHREDFCRRLFVPLVEKTTWPLELFVPYNVRNSKLWKSIIAENQNIRVHYINTTPLKGSDAICMWLFGRRLGMPSPRNVLVPSLMVSVWMGYSEIYAVGVEHSWHNHLWVNDQNLLMINDSHYYDTTESKYSRHSVNTMHQLFYSLYLAFGSYHTINRLARRRGVEIYNLTEGSYIDAFERKKL